MSGSGPNGSFKFDNPFAINGALTSTAARSAGPKAAARLTATLQAFERQGVAHTLAEPTVTAVSGESAKFLAGGTIPIPNSESCGNGGTNVNGCTIGFVQQPYGVTLNFTPVVLSPAASSCASRPKSPTSTIRHKLRSPSATTPPQSPASAPATTTRRSNCRRAARSPPPASSRRRPSRRSTACPALMNLPILGALFRSRDYQRNETELMIVVTPYIVHAIDPSQVVKPDQNFQDASDPQAWLLGRVNRLYSTAGALQPLPGYAGKIGFITQ